MADEPHFVVMTIECPHCKVKQKINVAARARFSSMEGQCISCIDCEQEFNIVIPEKIVGGPFHA